MHRDLQGHVSLTQHLIEEQRRDDSVNAELRLLIEVVARLQADFDCRRQGRARRRAR